MSDDYPRPTEVLKLVGSPVPEQTDRGIYSVHLSLSRALTDYEHQAVGQRDTPAGWLFAHHDNRRVLIVTQTTLEAVRDNATLLKQVVVQIVADGEKNRAAAQRAAEALQQKADADRAEAERRGKLAQSISFDDD